MRAETRTEPTLVRKITMTVETIRPPRFFRIRRVASAKDSGFDMAERSVSSAQGRRLERPLRTISDMLLMKERKAGVGPTALSDATAGCELEIGRIAGDELAIDSRNTHNADTIRFAGKHQPHRRQPLPSSQHRQPPPLDVAAFRRRTRGRRRCLPSGGTVATSDLLLPSSALKRGGGTKAATRLRRSSPSTIPPESLLLVLFVVEEGRRPAGSAASSEIPVRSELAIDRRCWLPPLLPSTGRREERLREERRR
nr:hypothetical protein Iba_chr10cCG3160 [Ipomoea batatas]